MNTVVITFSNDSRSFRPFLSFREAIKFCRDNISYNGGRVKRVEIHDCESVFAVWDTAWNAVSKAAGLAIS